MGRNELRKRTNWEKNSGAKANAAEQNLYSAFRKHFENTCYILHEKPKNLKNLYATVHLSEQTLEQIYNPPIDMNSTNWGISPDFAIENRISGKILFGEIKRQDGWIEGKNPNAGRGNAHERLCKLFSPGLLKACREIGQIKDDSILPFWVVFEGDITRDPKRNREIAFWFDKYDKNFFMWRHSMSDKELTDHFDNYLKSFLDL